MEATAAGCLSFIARYFPFPDIFCNCRAVLDEETTEDHTEVFDQSEEHREATVKKQRDRRGTEVIVQHGVKYTKTIVDNREDAGAFIDNFIKDHREATRSVVVIEDHAPRQSVTRRLSEGSTKAVPVRTFHNSRTFGEKGTPINHGE